MNTDTSASESRYNSAELLQISVTIKQQITIPSMMEVGAREFFYGYFTLIGEQQLPGLKFTAKPKSRLVDVYVLLLPSDTYRVIVRKRNVHVPVTLYDIEGVYADTLASIIRNLAKNV